MPQSLSNVIIHIIFSTINHYPYIQDDIENDLDAYIEAILHNIKCRESFQDRIKPGRC